MRDEQLCWKMIRWTQNKTCVKGRDENLNRCLLVCLVLWHQNARWVWDVEMLRLVAHNSIEVYSAVAEYFVDTACSMLTVGTE